MNETTRANETETAGSQYVAAYLPDTEEGQAAWIAEAVDTAALLACPRCHFLHLPRFAFPPRLYAIQSAPDPVDTCDVCAALPTVCCTIPRGVSAASLSDGRSDVADERRMRAETLFHLFLGPTNAADALLMTALADARDSLSALAQTPARQRMEP